MNYIPKEYEEIFEQMLNDSLEKGLISHAEEFPSFIANKEDISNYYVMDKSVIAEMFSIVYEDITNVYNSINIEIAEGEDLDNIGAIVGVPRPQATYAMCELLFTFSGSDEEDILISDEVIVATQNNIQYKLLEEIYIPVGSQECTVPAIAVIPGVDSKVIENTLTNILSDLSINLTCTNPQSSSGGSEAYDDNEYRQLLMNWTKIRLKGSQEAYENYFNNLDGIDGYKLIPNWDSTGTIKIVVDPGFPFLLNKIYDELQSNVAQYSEDITVFAPTKKYIDIYAVASVNIDRINPFSSSEKEIISQKIKTGIKTFIDGGYCTDGSYYQGLLIGEDFIPHKLAVFLDNEINELKSISFDFPENFIEILDEEIGVSNNITIEMI
ncbi:baseplate J-like protein [Methanobrevibacter oralis]|uniref:Baseplate J-like protein n=1 Tax=Methanobrevibacter oralis TaxID=66851 RepID=A0A165ZZT9_METOA|nr:baseplate J/gp47 family protein [Methanobrevibacter oralis]KZX11383.1 baseplate J-like protein [Methanobrevibacter oralis]